MKNGHEMFHHPGSSLRFPTKEGARARAATTLIEPIWQQFAALLPEHRTDHQLGCHRSGIPLGAVSAPVNRHDSPLLVPTLEAAFEALGTLPEGASVHLDCGYNSRLTRERLAELGLRWEISRLQVDLSLCGGRARNGRRLLPLPAWDRRRVLGNFPRSTLRSLPR